MSETEGKASLTCLLAIAEIEASRLEAENEKLRKLVVRMLPICMEGKRCTFADRIYINSTMEEMGIEVDA